MIVNITVVLIAIILILIAALLYIKLELMHEMIEQNKEMILYCEYKDKQLDEMIDLLSDIHTEIYNDSKD